MTDTMTCSVCCDPFTASRANVPCPSCNYDVCMRCVKTFLVSTPTEPNCMNCHHVWNREFLDQHFSRSWQEGDLKLHRANLLFDRERSLLPTTQDAVTVELQKRAYGAELPELCQRQSDLKRELAILQGKIDERHYFIRHGRLPGAVAEPATEKRQFVAACPDEACRGFLSTAYKCGTCQKQFCASCRELKPADAEHTCDPALVATMAAIAKECRPCPNCGMGISKVSGCDQMYCTQCDTAYSYQTGKVVTGVIHNPHYFERMKKLGTLPRQPGDVPCGGWPHFYQLPSPIRTNDILRGLFQSARHLEQVGLREYPTAAIPTDNTDLRVRYLLKDIDEKRFKVLVQQRDRKRQKELEIRAPLELFVLTALEFFLDKPTLEKLPAFTAQIETLVNTPLRGIGERYKNQVPQLDLATGGFKQFKA